MIRLIDIENIENRGIYLRMEMGEWFKVWPFGKDFIIRHSDHVKKDDTIIELAKRFIKGENVKSLLKNFKERRFSVTLYSTI